MKFVYKAKGKVDEVVEGVIDAPNREEALNTLWEKGLVPVDLIPEEPVQKSTGSSPTKKKKVRMPFLGKRITGQHVLIFTQNMTTLIRARVELLPALKIVYEYTDHPLFKALIARLIASAKEGQSFSSALENFPKVFPPLYINIIKAGEKGGRMSEALEQISEFIRREEGLKKKVSAALAYPAMLLLVGAASIFVLINFVIPRIKFMFESLENDLPLITRIILNISEFSNKTWWIVLGGGIFLIFAIYSQKGNAFFKTIFRRVMLATPILGRITRNQELAYFSHSLGMLLKSGVSAMDSLATTTPGIQNTRFRKDLEKSLTKVASGASLYNSLIIVKDLPGFFTKMIAVGEQSGRLASIFDELSLSCNEQIESDISLLNSLLEPLLILFMGLIMGAIVISILVPMFEITQMVG